VVLALTGIIVIFTLQTFFYMSLSHTDSDELVLLKLKLRTLQTEYDIIKFKLGNNSVNCNNSNDVKNESSSSSSLSSTSLSSTSSTSEKSSSVDVYVPPSDLPVEHPIGDELSQQQQHSYDAEMIYKFFSLQDKKICLCFLCVGYELSMWSGG